MGMGESEEVRGWGKRKDKAGKEKEGEGGRRVEGEAKGGSDTVKEKRKRNSSQ